MPQVGQACSCSFTRLPLLPCFVCFASRHELACLNCQLSFRLLCFASCHHTCSRENSIPPTSKLPSQPAASNCTSWFCVQQQIGRRGVAPIRVNVDGDIECMSTDGQNCLWDFFAGKPCNVTLANPPAAGSLKPLVCGSPGYNSTGHWCYIGRHLCPVAGPVPAPVGGTTENSTGKQTGLKC